MDVRFEKLGDDRVVISVKDFEDMLDLIAYDRAKSKDEESFPSSLTEDLIEGKNKLKAYRKYRGLSQQELGALANVQQNLISEIERGKKNGSIATLKRLSDALGLNLDDLI